MTRYEILLYLHIAAAIVWVGGGTMIQFFALRALRATGERLAAFAADVEWIGNRFLVPASLLAVASGIFMVVDGPWTFGDDWIVIGLVLFGITFLAGSAFFGPESGRISKLVAEHGPESPEAQARIRRILVLSRLDLILLFLIVYDMSVKPQIGDVAEVLVGLGGAAAAAAIVLLRFLGGKAAAGVAAARAD